MTEGSNRSFLLLIKGLIQKGLVNPVVILPDNEGLYVALKKMNVKTYVVDIPRCYYPSFTTLHNKLFFLYILYFRLLNNIKAVFKVKKIIQNESIDIVHTNTSVVIAGLLAAKTLGVPHVCHIREYADKDFNMHYIPSIKCYRRILSGKGCYTICITRDICDYHGFSKNPRSCVIYNGIASAMDACDSFWGNYILFAGRVESAKGVDQLIEAYIVYRKERNGYLPLLIAGEEDIPSFSMLIKRRLSEEGLTEDDVKFLGSCGDIEHLMQQARVLVVSSRFEAFGRCMPEAMFNKCLVIGKNTGGTKEQLDNGLNLQGQEIALRYDTTEELTQRLVEVTNHDKSFYDEMIQRAYDTVVSLYSNESYIDNVYNLYQEILKDAQS